MDGEELVRLATLRGRAILNAAKTLAGEPLIDASEFKLSTEQETLIRTVAFSGKDAVCRAAVSAGKTLGALLVNDIESRQVKDKNPLCFWLAPSKPLRNEKYVQFKSWETADVGAVANLESGQTADKLITEIVQGKYRHGECRARP